MKTLIIIILILANCALSSQVLDIDNFYESKLFFSIGGFVNWKYYGDVEINNYSKELRDYYKRKIEKPFPVTYIKLPDFLKSNEIKINENMYALKMDFKKQFAPFIINNDFTISMWGNGDIKIKFDIPDTLNKKWNDFFILSENRKYLDQIEIINPEQISDQTLRKKMTDLMKTYFENNINIFEKQITYLYLKDNNLLTFPTSF